jgi:hypothetical protein
MRNRGIHCPVLVIAVFLLAPAPAVAQSGEAEVRQVIQRLFDGMRGGDSAVVRSVFHSEARLQTVGVREGQPTLRSEAVDEFVRMVGSPRTDVWDERIGNLEVRVDGDLATAWMDYAFYVGDRFSHCGVNAFQLFRSADGWKVTQITDTRRREGCEAAPGH